MKIPFFKVIGLSLTSFILFAQFSCSKDSDLFDDYVSDIDSNDLVEILINDTYVVSYNSSTTLNVLENDGLENLEGVVVTNTTNPSNGSIEINTDNTIVYTSNVMETGTDRPITDTFIYTAQVENLDQTVSTYEGLVTVVIGLKAFPSAMGGGSNATGGRGGDLIHITTLDKNVKLTFHEATASTVAHFTGGLYAALQHVNPAYIIFDISGNINLGAGGTQNTFGFDGIPDVNNKTLFGQSAPQGGITISGGTFRFTGRFGDNKNLIFRYLRSRPIFNKNGVRGNTGGIADDDSNTWAFLFYGGNDVILDHCSASFSYDKNMGGMIDELGVGNGHEMRNFTFQNNLIADGHTNAFTGVNPNRPNDPENHMGSISWVNNVIAGGNRTANLSFNGDAEEINNVIFQPLSKMAKTSYNLKLNHIGNVHINVNSVDSNISHARQNIGDGGIPIIYTSGNTYEGFNAYPAANTNNKVIWTDFSNRSLSLDNSFFADTRHNLSTIPNQTTPITALKTYSKLVKDGDVGAYKYLDDDGVVRLYRDSFDSDILTIIKNRQVKTWHQISEWVLPLIPSNTRTNSYDSDKDGMSDAWEIREYGDLSQTFNGDFDSDGYTNIEEYMNQVDFY